MARSAGGVEAFGVEHGPLVVVAQQDDLAVHDQVDALARVGAVADDVAEAVDLVDARACSMSARTACRASRLLWMSLIRAITRNLRGRAPGREIGRGGFVL